MHDVGACISYSLDQITDGIHDFEKNTCCDVDKLLDNRDNNQKNKEYIDKFDPSSTISAANSLEKEFALFNFLTKEFGKGNDVYLDYSVYHEENGIGDTLENDFLTFPSNKDTSDFLLDHFNIKINLKSNNNSEVEI